MPTVIAVSSTGGPGSLPGTAAIGAYGAVRPALADGRRRRRQPRRERVDHAHVVERALSLSDLGVSV